MTSGLLKQWQAMQHTWESGDEQSDDHSGDEDAKENEKDSSQSRMAWHLRIEDTKCCREFFHIEGRGCFRKKKGQYTSHDLMALQVMSHEDRYAESGHKKEGTPVVGTPGKRRSCFRDSCCSEDDNERR